MRTVNEAYGLPDPSSLREKTVKGTKKTIEKLKSAFLPQKRKPARVSRNLLKIRHLSRVH